MDLGGESDGSRDQSLLPEKCPKGVCVGCPWGWRGLMGGEG